MTKCFVPTDQIGLFEITDPHIYQCDLCDCKAIGRVRFELYGGALFVCEPCFHKLRAMRAHPYSKIIDKFCMRACGYHVNHKFSKTSLQ